MEAIKLEKAYDLDVLGKRLVAKGLLEVEDAAVGIYAETEHWINQSATLSDTPWDDLGRPFLAASRPMILKSIDGIDKVTPEDLKAVAWDKVPMSKSYDFAVLLKRLKLRGLKEVEDLARVLWDELKLFLQESAVLSENKLDDIGMPFLNQVDPLLLPQIDKISKDV